MARKTKRKYFLILLVRGALGGVLGAFLWATTSIVFSIGIGPGGWLWLILGFLFSGLPAGVLIGGIIGTVIWMINRLTNASLGLVSRASVGTLLAMIGWFVFWWLARDAYDVYIPVPWHAEFLWIVHFGISIGGIAGVTTTIPEKATTALPNQTAISAESKIRE